ncbi:hypothetical protein FRACYDRAFT_252716 [Fragilariopsis cylindrus CCMP1102]|uniref:Uncharacterized protein n=1 Tax=Fragilariopsis cylindrus CCMP1102 TaxID=635003 RepID=A0A1E7ELR7_9STRA|nr:hypothetical protein FRACYDRAFT_252716 [Fragilariopsis cylindrus CCMP1102]|eukprot:OEU06858.1 hypothetical protein FRACYDRAFT_252716 [Fragilariopsis cylindrus CCMP1102]
MSIVGIVWNIIAIIIFALGSGAAAVAANADSLDLSEEDQENFRAVTINTGVVAGVYAILLCFSVFSLVAALRYSVCMLGTVVLFILVQLGWSLYVVIGNPSNGTGAITGGIIGSIIGYGLWLYPVIGLITEIKSGLMSKETYPREAQKFK